MDEEKKPVPLLLTPQEPKKPDRTKLCLLTLAFVFSAVSGIGHWNKYTRSAEYLSLTPENKPISEDELMKHYSPEDMWMALSHNGKLRVYDVTKFAEYHPGGYDLIATNAGTDATEEFRCAHAYVSADMISRLQKGYLVRSAHRKSMPNFLSPRLPTVRPLLSGERVEGRTKPTWDWKTISSSSVALEVALALQRLHSPLPTTHCLAVCSSQTDGASLLTLRVLRNRDYYLLKLRLLPIFHPDLTSLALDSSSDRSSTSWTVEGPASSSVSSVLSGGAHLLNPRLTLDLRVACNTDEQSRLQQFSSLGAILENRIEPNLCDDILDRIFECLLLSVHLS
ncbi:unnamed protein product [Dibothriocephalus latus]|uniref:Cytochrome b5 heme-binding domain-containing protein n=1 Tax=Dibothriocephalus latus TaxID=60516 RepID=A0A3P6SX21_DIBLA|nr:unnamed protein product [Dibothriocephalus latus]